MTRYRGLTWDHPRGYNALAAAAARFDEKRDGIAIAWDKQLLEGFESHPISDLCARYDLVVLDHPHIGEAVAAECLVPLEDILDAGEIAAIGRETIGPCLSSYRYAGKHWALPLDAATQVMAFAPDTLGEESPATWDEAVRLSARRPVALCLAGPHAILTLFSIATSLGEAPAVADPDTLISEAIGVEALDLIATLNARMPATARGLNPIGLLAAMAEGDAIALCPLVYGYVNYASPSKPGTRPLAFGNAPRASKDGRPGSTLGGTGIGVSRRCAVAPPLVDHLRWLMSADAQTEFIPRHDGQPSCRSAWHDPEVNEYSGHFYEATAESLERAYVRPRHAGYIPFQSEASASIREGLADGTAHRDILRRLQDRYAASRPVDAEP